MILILSDCPDTTQVWVRVSRIIFMMAPSIVIDRSDLVRTIEDEDDVQVDDSSSEEEDVAQPKKNKAARQAKKDFEPEFSFVSSQKEYMHDTWNDIAKYCKKKARTNLDDKIAKIRKERKGDEAAPSDSGASSEEELSEDELVEDNVKVKQGDLKRKMRKKATTAPDSGIDIQVSILLFWNLHLICLYCRSTSLSLRRRKKSISTLPQSTTSLTVFTR